MKKQDNQHLDFLISQYVDGSLEVASKKSVEQKLLTDPSARALYGEHREVQDLLDDWGSRIPMINWNEFDQNLAARLEKEEESGRRATALRRWIRPMAAAAALFIAASLGYAWHAWSHEAVVSPHNTAAVVPSGARTIVTIENGGVANRPNQAGLVVDEPSVFGAVAGQPDASNVAVSAPEDSAAVRSLMESVGFGTGNLPQSLRPQQAPKPAVGVSVPPAQRRSDGATDPGY